MKITINPFVLQRNHLTFGEFLVLLMGYYDVKYKENFDELVKKKLICPNVFNKDDMVLSNNTRDMVAKILVEADEKVVNYDLDFEALADKLRKIFPQGNKPGTTYDWRGSTEIIAFKLRTLVAKYGFLFTEEEAIKATREYVNHCDNKEKMLLLKYFILRTKRMDDGSTEVDSMFMTIIENNR